MLLFSGYLITLMEKMNSKLSPSGECRQPVCGAAGGGLYEFVDDETAT